MKIQFLGGVQTVTGSKTLVTASGSRILVDCGLFQGLKELRLRNREPFPTDPRSLNAVLLTHAHLDHSGYLPLLARNGFSGKIYASAPTRDLTELILSDSAKIQEEDADFANRHGYSKHHPALPLYTERDVKRVMALFQEVPSGKWQELGGKVRFRTSPSGHILGSTFVELEAGGRRITFSGDLGRSVPILYDPPSQLESTDFLVLESTYGDRTHHGYQLGGAHGSVLGELRQILLETVKGGGQVIIPSFAVGRTQDLLFLLSRLRKSGQLPEIPIYLDTPMGINATRIFSQYPRWHRLVAREVDELNEVATILRSQPESISVMREGKPCVIIAGSGMLTGGRVLHHLAARLPEERNTVLLAGYQAAGTRGRLLREGISELKIHGKYVPVRARVLELGGLSAHADQSETLEWLKGFERPPRAVFINHGEPQASDSLRVKIRDTLGWKCEVPRSLEEFQLD